MTEHDDTRSVAEDGIQESPQGPMGGGEGGRSSYGPSTSTSGEQEPGGLAPPYAGRKQSASEDPGDIRRDGANVGGATAPTESDEMKAPDPDDTPGGRTWSPGDDELPAGESPGGRPSGQDPDTGPAHTPGTGRGENKAD
jgi:hypothetical protein